MKNVVMFVRVPYDIAVQFAASEELSNAFDFVYVTVDDPPPSRRTPFVQTHVHGNVNSVPRDRVREFIRGVIRGSGVTHAIVSQPLLWYSEEVKAACLEEKVKVVWTEVFLSGKMIFDTVGCQYTKESELTRFAPRAKFMFPEEPTNTRAEQPPEASPADMFERYKVTPENTVVLFGQSHIDMAIVDNSNRLDYLLWMDVLIRNNPNTTFLYKPHPIYRDGSLVDPVSKLIEENGWKRVSTFSNSIFSAFNAFKYFAAYSSTVILEGAFRGKFFATGGRHFLDTPTLCLRIDQVDDAVDIVGELSRDDFFYGDLIRRLGFITRAYAMHPDDPRLISKLLLSEADFYAPYLS